MNIWLSEIDRQRFGVNIAKLNVSQTGELGDIDAWCQAQHVAMLIIRCPSERTDIVQQLEREGAQLMDTLVYYRKPGVVRVHANVPCGYEIRSATVNDATDLEQLAVRAFSGASGHYHADSRLAKADCDMVYGSWAANSCASKDVADEVILATFGGAIAGFLTLKCRPDDTVEIVLNAVDPRHQGRGLYQALVSLAQNWTAEQGRSNLIVSTQLTNLGPQKVWCRQSFEPFSSFYTLHKWF